MYLNILIPLQKDIGDMCSLDSSINVRRVGCAPVLGPRALPILTLIPDCEEYCPGIRAATLAGEWRFVSTMAIYVIGQPSEGETKNINNCLSDKHDNCLMIHMVTNHHYKEEKEKVL